MDDDKRVKFRITRLKSHAKIWWDNVQDERRKKNKPLIKSWDGMVEMMKSKLLREDY